MNKIFIVSCDCYAGDVDEIVVIAKTKEDAVEAKKCKCHSMVKNVEEVDMTLLDADLEKPEIIFASDSCC